MFPYNLSHLDQLLYSAEGDSLGKACSFSKVLVSVAALVVVIDFLPLVMNYTRFPAPALMVYVAIIFPLLT